MAGYICHIFCDSKVNQDLLTDLHNRLEKCFATVDLKVPENINVLDPAEHCFDKRRKQYKADDLVDYCVTEATKAKNLFESDSKSHRRHVCLYLLSDDAYSGTLNFVFGLAKRGIGCMVTLYRLENDLDFIFKECVHELGHVFKLGHCRLPCVMTFSNSVYEAHQKKFDFCDRCKNLLKQNP